MRSMILVEGSWLLASLVVRPTAAVVAVFVVHWLAQQRRPFFGRPV